MATDFYTYRGDIRPFGGGSPVAYVVDSTVTDLATGEMVAIKASTQKIVRFTRNGSAGDFVGISRESQTGLAKLGNQPALSAFVNTEFVVFTTGIHELLGTVGETYKHGDAAYMGANTQTITNVQGTGGVIIGIVWLPDATTKVGAVRVPILIDNHTLAQVGTAT